MSLAEDRAHFSMWCMLAAPLAAGNDLRKMSGQTTSILTNKEAIAIDQDDLGIAAYKIPMAYSLEVWIKPLKNNNVAVCFLNRASHPQKLNFKWADLTVQDKATGLDLKFADGVYALRDLWAKKAVGTTKNNMKEDIASHDVVMLKLTKL